MNATEVQSNTVTVNDIVLRLDALAQGYEEVLQAAKTQLESFEITESDWNKLSNRLVNKIDYCAAARELAYRIRKACEDTSYPANNFTESPNYNYDSKQFLDILETVATRVIQKIEKDQFCSLIEAAVEERTKELKAEVKQYAEQAARHMFASLEVDEINLARRQRTAMREMLIGAFGQDIKAAVRDILEDERNETSAS